jgi:hypothetical protein
VVLVAWILVVLVGLLIPAVTKIRAAATLTSCQNSLKQLTIGFHRYLDASRALPPLVDQGAFARTGDCLVSVFDALTPFLEAAPRMYRTGGPASHYHAHSSVKFLAKYKDGNDLPLFGGDANRSWNLFLDPADTTAEKLRDVELILPGGSTGY